MDTRRASDCVRWLGALVAVGALGCANPQPIPIPTYPTIGRSHGPYTGVPTFLESNKPRGTQVASIPRASDVAVTTARPPADPMAEVIRLVDDLQNGDALRFRQMCRLRDAVERLRYQYHPGTPSVAGPQKGSYQPYGPQPSP
jgi:hypothetical protein